MDGQAQMKIKFQKHTSYNLYTMPETGNLGQVIWTISYNPCKTQLKKSYTIIPNPFASWGSK